MLRSLYRCLLRLHPPGFRRRFGEEMLSIFDQGERGWVALSLLADGFMSLARQWALRPAFWHEISPATTPQTASDGTPSFYTLDPFRPRTAAVVNGLVLSLAIFCVTCFAIKYSWIHVLHIHIPEVEFESPQTIQASYANVTNSSFESFAPARPAGRRGAVPPAELRSLPQPSLDMILGANTPQSGVIQSVTAPDSEAGKVSNLSGRILRIPAPPQSQLSAYEGSYVVESPTIMTISITAEDGHLMMSVAGRPRCALAPVSETKFVVTGTDVWVEFVRDEHNTDGNRTLQLRVFLEGQLFIARRR